MNTMNSKNETLNTMRNKISIAGNLYLIRIEILFEIFITILAIFNSSVKEDRHILENCNYNYLGHVLNTFCYLYSAQKL